MNFLSALSCAHTKAASCVHLMALSAFVAVRIAPGPSSTNTCAHVTLSSSACIAESWQEMAAVLNMLQDMSEATECMPPEQDDLQRPASAQAPMSSQSQQQGRCASAYSPAGSKAEWLQHFASVPTSPNTSRMTDDRQMSPLHGQHPLSARCKSASCRSKASSAEKSKHRNSPLSASAKRQPACMREWQN